MELGEQWWYGTLLNTPCVAVNKDGKLYTIISYEYILARTVPGHGDDVCQDRRRPARRGQQRPSSGLSQLLLSGMCVTDIACVCEKISCACVCLVTIDVLV